MITWLFFAFVAAIFIGVAITAIVLSLLGPAVVVVAVLGGRR